MISVQDAESYFDIDEFNDLYAKTKPTLYIKMSDIFSIHQLVASDIDFLCTNRDDFLKEIIRELGNVKSNEHELMTVSTSEISLTLHPRLTNTEGEKGIFSLLPQNADIEFRSRGWYQNSLYGDQAMHSLYNQSAVWHKSHGGDA